MENIMDKSIDNLSKQIAKLQAVEKLLSTLKSEMQWCYKYDCVNSTYTDEVIDADNLEAYTAVYKDICKLYKLGDC